MVEVLGLFNEVEGRVNGSQAQANCNDGNDILLEKVEVMVCFGNIM